MKYKRNIFLLGALLIVILIIFISYPKGNPLIKNFNSVNRPPKIFPEYSGTVIPPNIAPINFLVKEKGERYFIRIMSKNGHPIEFTTKYPKVIIPFKKWKELLTQNRGQKLQIELYIEDQNGSWNKFNTITNQIANENIDSHLAYRLIHPGHNLWKMMGIYQRNLENYDEEPILINRATDESCMNCHSFCNNDPNIMMMHLRAGPAGGTLINRSGNISKVDTKTAFNKAGSYPSWHPNGKQIAFSVNQLTLFFHSIGECRDVLDHNSDIIVYLIESNTVTTCPDISNPDRLETFPAWSPDGKYLYFVSSPKLEAYTVEKDGKKDLLYNEIRYDLMRISYNENNGTWGNLETVLSSKEIGLSITEPRISFDGHFLLFTAAQYGNFPIYLKSSDVFILDLKTGKYYKPDINSDKTDSFHSWSSNSRWFVFSSKRVDGFCARPYFSYIDQNGKVYKPFVLPQEDPEFYASFLKTYNVPELIKGPVTVRPQDLIETAYNPDKFLQAKLDSKVEPRQVSDEPLKNLKNQPQ